MLNNNISVSVCACVYSVVLLCYLQWSGCFILQWQQQQLKLCFLFQHLPTSVTLMTAKTSEKDTSTISGVVSIGHRKNTSTHQLLLTFVILMSGFISCWSALNNSMQASQRRLTALLALVLCENTLKSFYKIRRHRRDSYLKRHWK